jgi:hypothetical protein
MLVKNMASLPGYASPHMKAALQISGDLNLACYEWTQQDAFNQHRLVVFRSYREGNTVVSHFGFASGTDDSKYKDFPRINCMFSRKSGKFFFIGTDALSAVERMLGVDLGEDRRKKLRNKFDKYGPITERNSKEDISDVFSLIKGIEKLKPRNVAKGVRVYRWERLEEFLVALASHVVSADPFRV